MYKPARSILVTNGDFAGCGRRSARVIIRFGRVIVHEAGRQRGQYELDRLPIDHFHRRRESVSERLLDRRHKRLLDCLHNITQIVIKLIRN